MEVALNGVQFVVVPGMDYYVHPVPLEVVASANQGPIQGGTVVSLTLKGAHWNSLISRMGQEGQPHVVSPFHHVFHSDLKVLPVVDNRQSNRWLRVQKLSCVILSK